MEESGHGVAVSTVVGDQNNIKNEEVDKDNNANNKDDNQKQASQQQQLLSKGNDAYYEYYRRQNICHNNNNNYEEETLWNEAYQKLRTSLPITYRIHESNPLSAFSVKLLSLIENDTDDDDERQLLEEWSFNDDAESNDKDKDNIPTLRMRIASNVHRSSNKSKKRSNNNITTNKEEEDNDYSSLLHALQELGAIHRQELVR